MQGFGYRSRAWGLRLQGLGSRGLGFRGLGFRGLGIWGLGFRVRVGLVVDARLGQAFCTVPGFGRCCFMCHGPRLGLRV